MAPRWHQAAYPPRARAGEAVSWRASCGLRPSMGVLPAGAAGALALLAAGSGQTTARGRVGHGVLAMPGAAPEAQQLHGAGTVWLVPRRAPWHRSAVPRAAPAPRVHVPRLYLHACLG